MLNRLIAFSAIILVGVFVLLPRGESDAVPAKGNPVESIEAPAHPPNAPRAKPLGLRRASDGHFYADAYVNDRPVRLLVDTGATVVALTGPDAQALGIKWDRDALAVIGRGAGGPVEGVPVTLERISLGSLTRQDIAAVVIPDGLPVSLLGQSFLEKVDSVRIENGEMILSDDWNR